MLEPRTFLASLGVILLAGCAGQDEARNNARNPVDASSQKPSSAADYQRPGFVTKLEDGRLWVLRDGQEMSEKHITLLGAGPGGITLKALDRDTALAYLATVPGFRVEVEDGRIWVLRDGQEMSEKHITRIGKGPRGTTLLGLDAETLDAYQEAVRKAM